MNNRIRLLLGAGALLLCTFSPSIAQTSENTTNNDKVVQLGEFTVTALKTFSDIADPNKTPMAITEVDKSQLQDDLAARDIPLIMNSAPSVYATNQGGGAGDSRINIRGFNQRNVSIMVNGVPVNDIENGWLYWSDWDGLGDVTSTIQLQRGISNVNLATPSIGGTLNIVTEPAAVTQGGSFKAEIGSDSFRKVTAVYNTGLVFDGHFAATVNVLAKRGDGYYNGTYDRGLGFYLGMHEKINSKNTLEFYVIDAPQEHGQNLYKQNIATYDKSYAKALGYTQAQLDYFPEMGRSYNQNIAPVNSSYKGLQYYAGGTHVRHFSNQLNERENYWTEPQVNLNWYFKMTPEVNLDSVFYFTGGNGGGSGTLGHVVHDWDKTSPYYGTVDWNATIQANENNTNHQSSGILRNSVNTQKQFGVVSKLTYDPGTNWTFITGIDARTATIDHYREVRDLLGGTYYLDQSNDAWTPAEQERHLGDKVGYFNTNTVKWLGWFAHAKYTRGAFTGFVSGGLSTVDYKYVDHFTHDSAGNELVVNPSSLSGYQIKGGAQYAFNRNFTGYVNFGHTSKVPIFDGVINDTIGKGYADPQNEKFTTYETGIRMVSSDRKWTGTASYYFTRWNDRTLTSTNSHNDTITYMRGVNADYAGLEFTGAYRPNHWMRFDIAGSIGDWTYKNDVQGQTFSYTDPSGSGTIGQTVYLNGLKVGDAPQTQFAYAVTVYPVHGLSIKLQGRHYNRYYANFDPGTRTVATDRGQAWEVPSYAVYDLHVNYHLGNGGDRVRTTVFLHILNLFNTVYVQDATDNSQYDGVKGAPSHSAARAEVFLGMPATYDAGVKFNF